MQNAFVENCRFDVRPALMRIACDHRQCLVTGISQDSGQVAARVNQMRHCRMAKGVRGDLVGKAHMQ
jgi:polygalacturonase